ncbi:MAG: hypothetical protein IPG92_10690 [Flavobacteriales bacterium]|nr:hypothetical protein [Flavobacteriales bacterium]
MATSCCSCNAADKCFGGKDEASASATCGKMRRYIAPELAPGTMPKLATSWCIPARSALRAQSERAAKLKESVFAKAVATNELPDGYAFVFREPSAFTAQLEEIAAFERKCCATFTWAVVTGNGTQELRVTGGDAKAEIGAGLRRLGWMQ